MRKLAIFAIVAAASVAAIAQKFPVQAAPETGSEFVERVYRATALLYSQSDDGSMRMRCTATAIEKTASGYVFVTASHCVGSDDEEHERVKPDKTFFFITSDTSASKEFMRAKLVGEGYQHESDDFALLEVDTKDDFPLVSIGKDVEDHTGQPVVNIASPLGLGKQTFVGVVSSPRLQRPVVQDDINWTNAMMVQITGVNGGSSGSAVICLNQRAICGFLVGTMDKNETVAIPVSRFVEFRKQVKAGNYPYREQKKGEKTGKGDE